LSSASESAEALKAEGNARRAAGDLEGAAQRYRRSLEIAPGYLPSLYNLGMVLHEMERLEEAEGCFRRLTSLAPDDAEALFHLGALLQRQARLEEAAEVFQRTARLAPGNPHALARLGEIGIARNTPESLDQAAESLRRALALDPRLAEAQYNLGVVAGLLGRHDEALRAYRAAAALQPDNAAAQANVLRHMQHMCEWQGFDEACALRRENALRADSARMPPDPFGLFSIPATLEEQLACARAYSRWIEERAAREARSTAPAAAPRAAAAAKPRLRVGYLSADFHEHVTAHVMAEVFELHDRSRIEAIGYSYGPDDRSAMRSRLRNTFARFVELRGTSNAQAAAAIRADEVDILVDLKGHTQDARTEIVALRPAPVQASFLGFAATMGASFIDYIITDRYVLPPQHQDRYSERPAYLPGCYYPSDRRRPRGALLAREALGLPAGAFVFCCFNQAQKILPATFGLWMRLLHQVPAAVLWLLDVNRWATENLRREAARHGIDPGRLVFSPKSAPEDYLARLRAADLFLDTWPYNAHTTASDALWVGLPVLTCPGETLPSRVAASQLMALGVPELVAGSPADYEARALTLARAPETLAALRERVALQRETSALFDTPRFTRGLEAAYARMWALHASGARPGMIEV
jgi:predicted O-linked N-acetylglucosamine transferase (SPINDLY family)